jgi:hypothetical protein
MTVLLADGQSRSLPFHPDRLGYSVSADTVGLWKSYAADVLSGQTQPAADMEPSPPEPAETQRPDAEATEASGEIPVEEQTDEEQTDEEQPVGETDGFSEPADRPATPKTETPAEQPEAKPDEPESRQDETPSEEDIPEILPVDAEQ